MNNKLYAQPELQLPAVGVLALVVEGNDVARVAASLNVSCTTVRGLATVAAIDLLKRYNDQATIPDSYAALLQMVKTFVRQDIVNAVAILTARERLEVFESFSYFRAFCNSPVIKTEYQHGQV